MKLTKAEKSIIEAIRDEFYVGWSKPYASPGKEGIYISITDRDEDDRWVSWKQWEGTILDAHDESVGAMIKLLENSLVRIKRKLKAKIKREIEEASKPRKKQYFFDGKKVDDDDPRLIKFLDEIGCPKEMRP